MIAQLFMKFNSKRQMVLYKAVGNNDFPFKSQLNFENLPPYL